MRRIENAVLATMASPARHVMAYIHRAIVNIAPEKQEAFDRDFDEFDIEYLDDDQWACHVDVPKKHIQLSRKPVEVLWASALMYFRLYQVAQDSPGGTEIEFALHAELRPSAALLSWAFKSWLEESSDTWPSDLPAPVPNPEHASDLHTANELCLGALAVLMHHELAHIRLCHDGPSTAELEREADYQAADWILDSVDETDPRFIKRSLCVAVAFSAVAAQEIRTGVYGGITHPRGFDRLVNCLDRFIQDQNHVVWFTVGLILGLHLQNVGGSAAQPEEGFVSARACVEAHVEALSRLA